MIKHTIDLLSFTSLDIHLCYFFTFIADLWFQFMFLIILIYLPSVVFQANVSLCNHWNTRVKLCLFSGSFCYWHNIFVVLFASAQLYYSLVALVYILFHVSKSVFLIVLLWCCSWGCLSDAGHILLFCIIDIMKTGYNRSDDTCLES